MAEEGVMATSNSTEAYDSNCRRSEGMMKKFPCDQSIQRQCVHE